MKTVLVIALQFAPVQTTGAFRSIALVKYLSEFGIRPIVLTIEPEEASTIYGATKNHFLLSGLPNDLELRFLTSSKQGKKAGKEGKISQYFRLLTSLDDCFYQRFKTSLDEATRNIVADYSIDIVYASMPPFGAARLAESAATSLGVPLILDFRDSWAEWELGPHSTYLHYLKKRKDEKRAFSAATTIIATTRQMSELFMKSHPQMPENKFQVVHNSFDGQLFHPYELETEDNKGLFNIAYVGSYYFVPPTTSSFIEKLRTPHRFIQYNPGKEDWSYRSPLYFFRAWRHLFIKAPEIASRIRFHHIGHIPDWLESMAADHNLTDYCVFEGPALRQDIPKKLSTMSALLITSMKRKDGEDYFIASKTFEYLTAKKPILGFVTKGSQRDLLINTGASVVCDPDDLESASQSIHDLISGKVALSIHADYINKFSSREMTKQISELIHKATVNEKMMK